MVVELAALGRRRRNRRARARRHLERPCRDHGRLRRRGGIPAQQSGDQRGQSRNRRRLRRGARVERPKTARPPRLPSRRA